MRAGRWLAALALIACGGAETAARPKSQGAKRLRVELLIAEDGARPARSEACERALDELGGRLSSVEVIAPDELAARLVPCPPPDLAATEKLMAKREDDLVSQKWAFEDHERVRDAIESCPSCGRERLCREYMFPRLATRYAWKYLDDDTDSDWIASQRCAAALVPRRTAELVLEHARRWAAEGRIERIVDCLAHCTLAPATRAELEHLLRPDQR